MKIDTLLNSVTDVLMGVKLGRGRRNNKIAQLDRGILDVALMIAALDGEILPAEVAAYYRLLGKCRGCAKKDAPAALDAALHKAGYLIARKQMGTSEKGCLDAFVRESILSLPVGFAEGSLADLRRAFVFWITMSLSDGSYSSLEHSAVMALADGFARVRCTNNGRRGKIMVLPLLEEDFFEKVERLVKDLSISAKRAKAQEALDKLINMVEVKDENGVSSMQPSNSLAVRAGLIALLTAAGLSCSALADGALPFGATLFGISF